MISDDRAEAALNFLAETDEEAAELKANVERCEYKLKALKATVFSLSEGTVADRNATVEMSAEVQRAWNAHCDAIKAYNTVANKRTTQVLIAEVWRTCSANRRKAA